MTRGSRLSLARLTAVSGRFALGLWAFMAAVLFAYALIGHSVSPWQAVCLFLLGGGILYLPYLFVYFTMRRVKAALAESQQRATVTTNRTVIEQAVVGAGQAQGWFPTRIGSDVRRGKDRRANR